jgi:GT2 family glycosyltransferase
MKKIDVSIIIVSYNTSDLTIACIESLEKSIKKSSYEIIVVDNDSHDESVTLIKSLCQKKSFLSLIENPENAGFAKANNIGVKASHGRYVLFLNSDTVAGPHTIDAMVDFMDSHPKAGAATCKLNTPDGSIDYSTHRGFPTPLNAFGYFSGLANVFPRSKFVAGYTQGWKDMTQTHTVDVISGAFMFTRREAGEAIGWWDEDYFFNGEDIDFCYMLHKKGWEIYYIPQYSILHYNGMSGGTKKQTAHMTRATKETRVRIQDARFDAMKIFYRKHYNAKYPKLITATILGGIELKRFITKKRLGL